MSHSATGPRSDEGKERSSRNATTHGLRSQRPIIPGEDPDEWDAFRADLVGQLDPATALERELAERVALQLWRLRRAARYEAHVAADEFERVHHDAVLGIRLHQAGEDVASQALQRQTDEIDATRQVLTDLEAARELARRLPGLPGNTPVDARLVAALAAALGAEDARAVPNPATAATAREALAALVGRAGAAALQQVISATDAACARLTERLAGMDEQLQARLADVRRGVQAQQRDRQLLPRPALERVVRYEAHVSRQLTQALQLLRLFQDQRRAKEEAAPAPAPRETQAAPRPEAITTSSFGNSDAAPPPAAPPHAPRRRPEGAPPAPAVVLDQFVRAFPVAQPNNVPLSVCPNASP